MKNGELRIKNVKCRKLSVRLFFILNSSFLILFSSCTETTRENTNIPEASIYFQIRLSNYSTFANGIGNVLNCPADLIGSDAQGNFGYSGNVILFNDFSSQIWAFDACCTNPECVMKKNKVSPELRAKCSYCNSVFDLSANGSPVSGSAKYALRRYKIGMSGNILIVSRYDY